VVQASEELRFTLETSRAFGVGADSLGEDFDGDLPIEASIDGSVHLAHAASPECANDFIGAEPRSDRQCHILVVPESIWEPS
jgi:hypothetical protein